MKRSTLSTRLAVVALALFGVGCKGTDRTSPRAGGVRATDGPATMPSRDGGSRGAPPVGGGEVALTNEDLAPVDAYVRKRVWYVGDEVDVVASREYFWQYVSFVAAKGVSDRHDAEDENGLVVTVTYLGPPALLDESTAPRILIGTGITVSARKRLVVRFVRTRDADVPVRLRIAATGEASMGQGAQVLRRKEPQIVVGCLLRRVPGGRYEYREQ